MSEPVPGWRLRETARRIAAGGVVAYPTEAVYGLGCDPLDGDAVLHLLALKGRPVAKGVIVIAADFVQLVPLVAALDPGRMRPLHQSWPGPATWLLPARPTTPTWLTGRHATLAVRVTAHPVAAALCRVAGPLVSTSANPAGRPPARDALTVHRYFGGTLDGLIVGAVDRARRPSTIRDARDGRMLRSGG